MKTDSPHNIAPIKLSALQQEIVEKLAYFGLFKHPLQASELQNLLHNYYNIEHVNQALATLEQLGLCYQFADHFSVHEDVKQRLKKRQTNEESAEFFFEKLPFFVRLMSAFPYVRGIAISGSLSKGVIHADGDIDYFIITTNKRLWLARMLLIIFKKLFLLNSHRYFCVNYFISEKHLEIPDKNLFTATEISTLIPVYGHDVVRKFKSANAWVSNYYGHFEHPIEIEAESNKKYRLKKVIEFLLNNPFGNWLDKLFMYITIWRWDVKFKHFDRSKFNLALRSTRNVSKHHPQDFQTQVLTRVEESKRAIYAKLNATK